MDFEAVCDDGFGGCKDVMDIGQPIETNGALLCITTLWEDVEVIKLLFWW